ncbi:hypothetical protein PYW07_008930 [Mythimna separata]|uniref:Uncharacterized protein n=1 Tax=Mythimna separata TaxID=271217 RepID=A0AAD8DM36_MYTSE|nr:hypothetical protein PYW07_008930 [Mythimna separata]
MHFMTFATVTIIMLVFIWQSETSKICYKAKVCIHDGKEKCGINRGGTPRRFLDSCDILEYNCLYNQSYAKTEFNRCPIPTPFLPGHAKVINKHWCWRVKYCHNSEGDKVCGVDIRRRQRKIFPNLCTMFKHNCHLKEDYTASVMYECSLIPSVWKQIID